MQGVIVQVLTGKYLYNQGLLTVGAWVGHSRCVHPVFECLKTGGLSCGLVTPYDPIGS
jgi:hypothetical protein